MSWLNNFLATPAIGIQIIPSFPAVFHYMEELVPLVKDKYGDVSITFSKETPTSFELKTKKGFNFKISHDNLIIEFAYIIDYIKESGGFPYLKHEKMRSYTDLMNEAIDNVNMIWQKINELDDHEYKRLGLVASCTISESDMPPGISLLSDYLAKPWEEGLTNFNGKITARIGVGDGFIEQCHHTIERNYTGEKDEVTINLDFQRLHKENAAKGLNRDIVIEFSDIAVQYFERFGIGELNYG